MLRSTRTYLVGIVLLGLIGTSCGDIRPLWKGEKKLSDQGYALYRIEPCEFEIEIKTAQQEVDVMLELAITYYLNIARTQIPLFLILEDESHNITEYATNITIREEGELLGYPDENEVDYTISQIAIPELTLTPGFYNLKIYSNDRYSEKVDGLVKIVARVFEITPEEEG
ncbi:MAG: hypothetical protein AAFQ83_11535 [Bacteroidota bacterium]